MGVKRYYQRTITAGDEWEEFGRICDKNLLNRSGLIRGWIKKWLEMAKKGKLKVKF